MMSANGCLVIRNTPPTKGIVKPDLIMASVRATPKKMMVTSRGTIENKKSQFKQAHPRMDSQASPNLTHALGTKYLGQLPKNGARGFILVTPAWLQKAVNGTVRKLIFLTGPIWKNMSTKYIFLNFPTIF